MFESAFSLADTVLGKLKAKSLFALTIAFVWEGDSSMIFPLLPES
jgi:hypothetical protein